MVYCSILTQETWPRRKKYVTPALLDDSREQNYHSEKCNWNTLSPIAQFDSDHRRGTKFREPFYGWCRTVFVLNSLWAAGKTGRNGVGFVKVAIWSSNLLRCSQLKIGSSPSLATPNMSRPEFNLSEQLMFSKADSLISWPPSYWDGRTILELGIDGTQSVPSVLEK